MQTVLPYIGSKKRIVNVLKQNLPEHGLYVEPFSGGFSLGLELLELGLVQKAHLNDLKQGVFDFWVNVKEDPSSFYSALVQASNVLERLSDEQRENYDLFPPAIIEYMSRTQFRGMFSDKLPLSFGLKSNLENILHTASNLMQSVDISNVSYEDLEHLNHSDTFWYFDPPYWGYNNASFYGMERHVEFNHLDLMSFLKGLKGKFILSNSNTGFTQDLYQDFFVYEVYLKNRGSVGYTQELLVSNYELDIPDEFTLADSFARDNARLSRKKTEEDVLRLFRPKRQYVRQSDYSFNTVSLFD